MQVLAGLHYFHELKDEQGNWLHGVHRDVSPQNVVVMHEGVVKVLDFGIAKLREPESGDVTRAGIIKGKLSYMPPEQLIGDATIDRRADVFAVGVMLWEALARRRMWEGVGQQDMMRALVEGHLPSVREACPWLTESLAAVVERAIAPRREDRYQTALELQVALEQCMAELGGFVQQRELSSFMEAEFGDWRRDRQRTVDAELRGPAIGLGDVLEPSVVEDAAVESQSLEHGHVRSRIGPADPERRWLMPVVALMVAALAIGFLYLTRARERETQALPPPAPLPVPAPVHIVVRESPAAAASPVAEPSVSPSARAKVSPPQPRGLRRPAPSAVPAGASPVVTSRSCNPPYVLDKEGVKTYRPECL
jgi:hypothetical protein